jgi:hypothetical protein
MLFGATSGGTDAGASAADSGAGAAWTGSSAFARRLAQKAKRARVVTGLRAGWNKRTAILSLQVLHFHLDHGRDA